MSELYRRLPYTQEDLRPKKENSDRSTKQRLFSLREELNRVEDDISYQQLNKSQANLASLLKKRDTLQKEVAEIEFSLMSEAEKNERLTELEKALEKFDNLQKKKSTDKDYYQAKKQIIALQKEIKEKKQQIPAGAWKAFVARKEKSEEKDNECHLQEKAKEAITAGILQLNLTLEAINRTKGSLPGTIIYPETTTRPLSYAVEPLLKKIYSNHQQEMPQRVFVKTFSEHQMDKDRKLDQERNEKLKQLQNELRKNQETIAKTKRKLKKYRPRTKEYVTASEQIHQLQEKKKNLRGSIVKLKENIRIFEQGADLQAMRQRINEITSNASDNPILVIDDLVGRGRTFRALNDALKDAGHDDAYFFSFLATPYSLQDLPIPNNQFSTGTIIQDAIDLEDSLQEDGEEKQEFIPNFAHDRIVEADTAWSSLLSTGFPFRLKKEEATGVLKDQMDPNPYVVRSDKGNPFLMHSLRQQYRAWGEEALKNSGLIDIQTPTKEVTDNPETSSLETAEPYAFSRLTNKEWRQEVLERVDQLIEQITENEIEELIFLDKSARPLSWLIKERWKHKNHNDQAPKIKYIDLGLREMKGDQLGEETIVEQMQKEAEDLYRNKKESQKSAYTDDDDDWFWKKDSFAQGDDVDGEIWMSKKHISQLWKDVISRHPELIAKIRARYGAKLGKTLIIDELLFSGGTLNTTVALFTEAYPETEIHGIHFFNQNHKKPTTQIPWFKKKHMIGVEEDENSLTTKRFSKHESQDPDLSKELRKIIKDIAKSDLEN